MNECEMCTHPGSCCVIFSLTGGNFKTGLFDEGTDFDKMLVDEKLPFIVRRVVQEGDQVRAFFGCNHLTKGGFCSIYDSRPDVCFTDFLHIRIILILFRLKILLLFGKFFLQHAQAHHIDAASSESNLHLQQGVLLELLLP